MTAIKPADDQKKEEATGGDGGAAKADGKAGSDVADKPAVPERKPGGPGRRAPGAKEVIPFSWKLIGTSGDMTVTLFKAIEKPDVEAQLERLRRDGYYKNLEVLDVDAVVTQPVTAKKKVAHSKTASEKATASDSATTTTSARKSSPTRKRASTSKSKSGAKKASPASAEVKPKRKTKTGSATKRKR